MSSVDYHGRGWVASTARFAVLLTSLVSTPGRRRVTGRPGVVRVRKRRVRRVLSHSLPNKRAQPQNRHYVYNGKILQVVDEDLALAKYKQWQVWLYQEGVRIPHYSAGLQYSRWGLIEGNSAENVIKQLQASQSFEAAYLKFFGPGTWGQYTFFNPVGPIAVTDRALEDQPTALEKLYQLRWLYERVNKLISAVRPSLENNEADSSVSPVKKYFDQIRDVLQRVSKLHSQLSRDRPQLRFIESGIAQAKTQAAQAEDNVPKITAVLPSVKLPTGKTWMLHSPERKTARPTFPAVHHTTTESSVYFVFANSGEAQDAYAYFLYHKQLGR